MQKKALITGITGQDGSYLAEQLLEKGYDVYGLLRRVALPDQDRRSERINPILKETLLIPCDITNYASVYNAIQKSRPDEIYHLAAQSDVAYSFKDPFQTIDTNINGTLNVLESMRNISPEAKMYFAGSSEMFGRVLETPQTEKTRFNPRSPYGVSKCAGFELCKNYRESYDMFVCSGILFNHESPRRGREFVTRKITKSLADMIKGKNNVLILGNLESKRDWGFAGDYVKAMWLMLQQDKPEDFVIGTGETHSIKEFIDTAFNSVNMTYELKDFHTFSDLEADKKIETLKNSKGFYVVQHPQFYRPAEVDILLADSSKAERHLGWKSKVSFPKLVEMMVKEDLK